ncbi:MAG: DUF2807 domain-containing protein [Magnetococcus sp. THC-1_WYH]
MASLSTQATASIHSQSTEDNLVEETRSVGYVHKINLTCDGTLSIDIGFIPKLIVQAPEAWMPYILTTTNGSTLTLGVETPPAGETPTVPLVVFFYLTTTRVKDVNLTSGVLTAGNLASSNLTIGASGGSQVTLTDQNLTTLNTTISGSACCQLSGTASTQSHGLSGSGKFCGFSLQGSTVKVTASASTLGLVYAQKSLTATASGSATVVYDGNPTTVKPQTSGSGQVIPASSWKGNSLCN